MNGTTLPQMASVQELQRHYRKLLDLVKRTKEPLYLLRNNKPEAVILDLDKYEEMVEVRRKAEEADTLAMYKAYKKAKKEGKLKTVKSLGELI
ncbi:type II toxin-antitoxin system Phd/YefM family antitoxin [Patescibacteria group bacterium]|nr:type II toxin-antitoxin system Phd/YefM family antitoxin [Patescibacteria group bacterium]MBU4511711.1 type II toxin-antitoxin system Phd/YefM family antitoxin [Patescibacteria group bacterium]MCG2692954.1 type II toxin-antitoxin system Phd/YefM family antitoxin [Candidatus Parcubacteria bacterium]